MKLKANYAHGNIDTRLKFIHSEQKGISLEFAYRLAGYVEYIAKKTKQANLVITLSSGYRDTAYQKALFDTNVKQYPPNGNGKVAQAGRSWHEARCAVDITGAWWQQYLMSGDYLKTVKQQELYKFGLCMPLNKVDAKSVFEWWHIQPIETLAWTNADTRKAFMDYDDELYTNASLTVYEFQAIMDLVQDGVAGPKTKAAATKAKTMPMYKASKVKQVVDKILKGVK